MISGLSGSEAKKWLLMFFLVFFVAFFARTDELLLQGFFGGASFKMKLETVREKSSSAMGAWLQYILIPVFISCLIILIYCSIRILHHGIHAATSSSSTKYFLWKVTVISSTNYLMIDWHSQLRLRLLTLRYSNHICKSGWSFWTWFSFTFR